MLMQATAQVRLLGHCETVSPSESFYCQSQRTPVWRNRVRQRPVSGRCRKPGMTSTDTVEQFDRLVPDSGASRKQVYRIGDLAREFDVTLRALRFYEDKGLIAPRRQGSTRLYSERERARLKIILLAKQVGFSLAEITEIMEICDNDAAIDDPLGAVLEKFVGQRQVLDLQKRELEAAMQRLEATVTGLREMRQN
jgi:DNA-binding transcriptional MerR regulator